MDEFCGVQKNDVLELTVENIGMGGEGVAHIEGYTIFIRGGLPGERVRAKIILVKKGYGIAICEKILSVSPDRVVPRCSVFGKCGGCQLQHLRYEAQLAYKQNYVRETFWKAGERTINVLPTVPSERQYGYRNKFCCPVRGNPPRIGFFAAGTHRLVAIDGCPIQFDGNEQPIALFLRFMEENGLTGYDESMQTGDVRHFSVRSLGGNLYITVVSRTKLKAIGKLDETLRKRYGDKYCLYENINSASTNVIFGEETRRIGAKDLPAQADGLTVETHPKSFFQVNDDVRAKLYAAVNEACGAITVDAYSGAGILAAILAQSGKTVYSVELSEQACACAKTLNRINGITSVTVECGDCGERIPRLLEKLRGQNSTLLLDPPRAGCAKSVLDAALLSDCRQVVYVSCNPATLARDCRTLTNGGFTIERVQPFDMFPQTSNVETLVVLSRR